MPIILALVAGATWLGTSMRSVPKPPDELFAAPAAVVAEAPAVVPPVALPRKAVTPTALSAEKDEVSAPVGFAPRRATLVVTPAGLTAVGGKD